jgi:hypothetical protein
VLGGRSPRTLQPLCSGFTEGNCNRLFAASNNGSGAALSAVHFALGKTFHAAAHMLVHCLACFGHLNLLKSQRGGRVGSRKDPPFGFSRERRGKPGKLT